MRTRTVSALYMIEVFLIRNFRICVCVRVCVHLNLDKIFNCERIEIYTLKCQKHVRRCLLYLSLLNTKVIPSRWTMQVTYLVYGTESVKKLRNLPTLNIFENKRCNFKMKLGTPS